MSNHIRWYVTSRSGISSPDELLFIYGVQKVLGCTDSLTNRPLQDTSGTVFQRWQRHKNLSVFLNLHRDCSGCVLSLIFYIIFVNWFDEFRPLKVTPPDIIFGGVIVSGLLLLLLLNQNRPHAQKWVRFDSVYPKSGVSPPLKNLGPQNHFLTTSLTFGNFDGLYLTERNTIYIIGQVRWAPRGVSYVIAKMSWTYNP